MRSIAARAARLTESSVKPSASSTSEKSICASTAAIASIRPARIASHSRLSAPPAMRWAWRRCASVSASTRSASPSASVRSILPLTNARQANSPGSARRSPGMAASAFATAAVTARPPVTLTSAISSPVKLRGALNRVTRARSSGSAEPGRRKVIRTARRSGNSPPGASASSAAEQPGPEMRSTAIAARPTPDAGAKIVSWSRANTGPPQFTVRRRRNAGQS